MPNPKKIRLRRVQESDSARLLQWRNDPVTRRNSFSTKKIKSSQHEAWLKKALASERKLLLMAVNAGNRPVGILRYDKLRRGNAEVNINLSPEQRGKGMGAEILMRGSAWLRKNTDFKKITARIKKTNLPSQRAFTAAGFRLTKKTSAYDIYERTFNR